MTLVLIGPAVVAGAAFGWQRQAKVGVTLLFLTTGVAHFVVTNAMSQMVPPPIPFKTVIIYITGFFEIAGAIGIWIPRYERIAGTLLALLIIAVFPANIYTALSGVVIEGQHTDARYLLVRVPFEILLVLWTYYATHPQAKSAPLSATT